MWGRLGAEVTTVEFMDAIGAGMDADLAYVLYVRVQLRDVEPLIDVVQQQDLPKDSSKAGHEVQAEHQGDLGKEELKRQSGRCRRTCKGWCTGKGQSVSKNTLSSAPTIAFIFIYPHLNSSK